MDKDIRAGSGDLRSSSPGNLLFFFLCFYFLPPFLFLISLSAILTSE